MRNNLLHEAQLLKPEMKVFHGPHPGKQVKNSLLVCLNVKLLYCILLHVEIRGPILWSATNEIWAFLDLAIVYHDIVVPMQSKRNSVLATQAGFKQQWQHFFVVPACH